MDVELVAQIRNESGKGVARRLRRMEMVPAIFYGPKSETLSLCLPTVRMERLLREMGEEHKLLRLTIEGGPAGQEKQVMIREIQVHPAKRQLLHVDFYEVAMDQAIVIDVPVELKGRSVGMEKGGLVDLVRRTLAVRCLPGEIPEKIEIDISDLDLGDSVHIADLVDRLGFELADDKSFTVVTVLPPEGMVLGAESDKEEESSEA
jgi:large subunit ribosomal protein L25